MGDAMERRAHLMLGLRDRGTHTAGHHRILSEGGKATIARSQLTVT